jgi:hypothetical protein
MSAATTTATIPTLRVPYSDGYDYGIGTDLLTGSPMDKMVKGARSTVKGAGGATVEIHIQRIHTTSELERALGVGAEASYGAASFGAGVSARFSFARESKIQTSSLFMVVTAEVRLAFQSIDEPELTSQAAEKALDHDAFTDRYGNSFVRGLARGGLFVGVLRLDTTTDEASRRLAADLKGSYGLFSAEARSKFQKLTRDTETQISVAMYHEGGPTDLHIKSLDDPLELLENANRFIKSFDEDGQAAEIAVPYFALLAPAGIAGGPGDSGDISRALAVLRDCAEQRSAKLDQRNLLEYVLQNPTRFEMDGNDRTRLESWVAAVDEDLRLLDRCARNAIEHPHEAVSPDAFARQQKPPSRYPKLASLSGLPRPVAPADATVPSFSDCKNADECHARAAANAVTVSIETPYSSTFEVIDQDPDRDTRVRHGTTVTVRTRPVIPLPHLDPHNPLRFFADALPRDH